MLATPLVYPAGPAPPSKDATSAANDLPDAAAGGDHGRVTGVVGQAEAASHCACADEKRSGLSKLRPGRSSRRAGPRRP